MKGSENTKDFNDPLFARMEENGRSAAAGASNTLRNVLIAAGVLAGFAALGYYLVEAQDRLDELSTSLNASQAQLATVTDELGDSKEQIQTLEKGLSTSQSKLSSQGQELNRYKGLYNELSQEQQQQGRNLDAITIQKADKTDVDLLAGETEALKARAGEIRQQVEQTQSSVAQLREQTARNRSDIEGNQQSIGQVNEQTAATAGELSDFKQSFERDTFNFELQEKGGIIKVFNVALRLTDVDFGPQRYDLEIFASGKRIKRKDQYINEPITFYVEGVEKPYEIVITKVGKKFAVGYLSTPKIATP